MTHRLPPEAGEQLLGIARGAIEVRLAGTPTAQIPLEEIARRAARPDWLMSPGASFVSLEQHSRLRGCIGTLVAHRSLYEDVAHNAVAASLHDPRFPPLSPGDLAHTTIEVLVLSERVPLPHSSEESVVAALRPGIDGVVLEAGPFNRATFLPQVWEDLPDPQDFLNHLKLKAGLPTEWWSEEARLELYTVQSWIEGDMPS